MSKFVKVFSNAILSRQVVNEVEVSTGVRLRNLQEKIVRRQQVNLRRYTSGILPGYQGSSKEESEDERFRNHRD